MKITGVTVMAAIVVTTVWAGALPAAERQVTVCMGYTGNLRLEHGAKVVSSDIFAGIGVKILWHDPRPRRSGEEVAPKTVLVYPLAHDAAHQLREG